MPCWAECLGGCSDKMSREHLVSESLFPEGKVRVEGFPWCREAPKEIGIAGLTAKILCERHNNALSPIDTAGAAAFKAFEKTARLAATRERMKPHHWNVVRDEINGPLFERWLLKTLINICCDQGLPIGRDSAP